MENEEKKIPEDLGIVIGSDDMVFWKDVIEKTSKDIENLKKMLKFNGAILNMAQRNYDDAKAEFEDLNGGY